ARPAERLAGEVPELLHRDGADGDRGTQILHRTRSRPFTTLRSGSPRTPRAMASAAPSRNFRWAAWLTEATWGARRTFFIFKRGWSAGIGSGSHTSSAAAPR